MRSLFTQQGLFRRRKEQKEESTIVFVSPLGASLWSECFSSNFCPFVLGLVMTKDRAVHICSILFTIVGQRDDERHGAVRVHRRKQSEYHLEHDSNTGPVLMSIPTSVQCRGLAPQCGPPVMHKTSLLVTAVCILPLTRSPFQAKPANLLSSLILVLLFSGGELITGPGIKVAPSPWLMLYSLPA